MLRGKTGKDTLSHVGFVVENPLPYNEAMASTRIRSYDVINYLNAQRIPAELYNGHNNYDIVIFQKSFQPNHIELAKRLQAKGTKIILDINVNYVLLENEAINYVKSEQKSNILKMLGIADGVIVASEKLGEIYKNYHERVTVIEESIEDRFFRANKVYEVNEPLKLLYCGYAIKAAEVLLIKEVLKALHKEFSVKMLYICEKDPKLDIIPYQFLEYNHALLPGLLLKGDIKIAPRDLSNSYNWGHTFTKVAYPMAVGLPAVASPVPSYLNRGVLICNNQSEWYDVLQKLISSADLRKEYGLAGKKIVKENFSIEVIGRKYIDLFRCL